MEKGDKCVLAYPGGVPLTGVIAKVSKTGKWVDVSWDTQVFADPRIALPSTFFFVQEKEV